MSKDYSINYIKHLKNLSDKMAFDNDLNATHISIYMALFHLWNKCGFKNNLSINRNDVMNLAKVGSVNTYLKVLRELHDKAYIQYNPSKNPQKGSTINLFRFDTSSDIVQYKHDTSSDTSTDTSSDTLYKLLNKETIKLIETNEKKFVEYMNGFSDFINGKKDSKNKKDFIAPTLEEMQAYFLEKGYSKDVAVKVFDYYTELNWHDSKGNPVKNWKSKCMAVWFKPENLIINQPKPKPEKGKPTIDPYYDFLLEKNPYA